MNYRDEAIEQLTAAQVARELLADAHNQRERASMDHDSDRAYMAQLAVLRYRDAVQACHGSALAYALLALVDDGAQADDVRHLGDYAALGDEVPPCHGAVEGCPGGDCGHDWANA